MNLSLAFQVLKADINFLLILPELIVGFAAVLVMLVDAFARPRQRWLTGGLALFGLLAAAVSSVWMWLDWAGTGTPLTSGGTFNGMIVLDGLRLSFTLIFLLVSALTILISMVWVEGEDLPAGEFHSLLLFATAGMMLMASGGDLVIIFLGLEILSIATYVMAGFRRTDLRSNESSLKYFILGSFSSAFLLYGIALIYGATATEGGQAGTTNIAQIAVRINDSIYPPLLFAGAAMLLVGFGFKVATAPFHIWTPDVYEGAPTPVTAFMAAGPKAAGFASFLRVFVFGFPFVATAASTAGLAHAAWLNALLVMAIITMTVGNVVAIVQNNVKRMLAYSSIAHAGYALVGFIGAGATSDAEQRSAAMAAVAFYMLTYAVMNLGAFAVVTLISRSNDRRTEVEDYNGIGFRAPTLAFALSLFLLSLLGMPLTAGFMGKIMVFRAALNEGYYGLVVIAVLNTAISAYYYLRLIIVMFFRERTTQWIAPHVPASIAAALVITILGVFYLGLFPGRVIDAFQKRPGVTTAATTR
ncbi:MAG TPA: NADH-quinone oxidoreductase subunit N [Pyrinomonadaceae bacterium]|jgi:NADH-quinone oxidoreductase subunit N|nr:NADH-quinone oxidoreductase subunit N [Pyrinomonadaceae bacterium]